MLLELVRDPEQHVSPECSRALRGQGGLLLSEPLRGMVASTYFTCAARLKTTQEGFGCLDNLMQLPSLDQDHWRAEHIDPNSCYASQAHGGFLNLRSYAHLFFNTPRYRAEP
jgi:hypothetical protein